MLEINRRSSNAAAAAAELSIKVLGLGGAGANALDRLLLDGMENAELIALNTDAQALIASVAPKKVQLGKNTTRGLGAGGDPELGYAAAEESMEEIKAALEGAALVFLVVGLGGGTGSGAAPLIASYARELGALVVVFATVPFEFEGKRRSSQAQDALNSLQHYADVIVCFENDKLGDLSAPRAGIHEAFAVADVTLSQSVRAIGWMAQRPGIMRVGFDELQTVLRGQNARCLFGFGEAEGDNRAYEAIEQALKSPLMERGRMLAEADNVLVNVLGGPDLTLNEVQMLMGELNRHINDRTRLLFGTATDPRMGGRLSVMVLSSLGNVAPETARVSLAPVVAEPAAAPVEEEAVAELEEEEVNAQDEEDVEEFVETPVATVPVSAPKVSYTHSAAPVEPAKTGRPTKQEQMTFEPVTRGRFEKSEPTIVDGQDLDVPAFMRRHVRVK